MIERLIDNHNHNMNSFKLSSTKKPKINFDKNNILNKKTFFLSHVEPKVNKLNNPELFNVILSNFDNPDTYLNEDNDKIIVGKKSNKETLSIILKNIDKSVKGNSFTNLSSLGLRKNTNMNMRVSLLGTLGNKGNNLMLSKEISGDNNQMIKSLMSKTVNGLNLTSCAKTTREIVDNNSISDISNKIKKRFERNQVNSLFDQINTALASTISEQMNKPNISNAEELNKQEHNLKTYVMYEETNDSLANRISYKIKRNKEKLLINKSSLSHRLKMEQRSNCSFNIDNNSSLDWQLQLRFDKQDSKATNKTIIPIGKYLPIHAIVPYRNKKNPVIIRKPNHKEIELPEIDFEERLNSERFETRNCQDLKSSIIKSNKPGNRLNINDFLKTTKSLWSEKVDKQYDKQNDKYSKNDKYDQYTHSKLDFLLSASSFVKKENDYNNLFLKGISLLDYEKDLALSIKGKKVLIRIGERDRLSEEIFAVDSGKDK